MRREWPTDIGPVDLMCRDEEDGWIAVEIKRVATIDAVEQLTRYLERIRLDPAMADCRGVLAAQQIKPQARTLAESRGIACVEVDLAVAARRARAGPRAVRLVRRQPRHERPDRRRVAQRRAVPEARDRRIELRQPPLARRGSAGCRT